VGELFLLSEHRYYVVQSLPDFFSFFSFSPADWTETIGSVALEH